jgi:LysM repeat protein
VTAKTARASSGPAEHAVTWTVQPGDTLSAIAAALGLPGGWQALYAANRPLIGPDPGLIHAGTVLTVPGRQQLTRYTVAPGDTLSAIAVAVGVPGGWQALYAANRQVIGSDPNVIRAGIVLAEPRQAAPAGANPAAHREAQPAASAPARHPRASTTAPTPAGPRHQVPAASRPASHPAAPGHATEPAGGMPRWLEDVLLAAEGRPPEPPVPAPPVPHPDPPGPLQALYLDPSGIPPTAGTPQKGPALFSPTTSGSSLRTAPATTPSTSSPRQVKTPGPSCGPPGSSCPRTPTRTSPATSGSRPPGRLNERVPIPALSPSSGRTARRSLVGV